MELQKTLQNLHADPYTTPPKNPLGLSIFLGDPGFFFTHSFIFCLWSLSPSFTEGVLEALNCFKSHVQREVSKKNWFLWTAAS